MKSSSALNPSSNPYYIGIPINTLIKFTEMTYLILRILAANKKQITMYKAAFI